MVVAVCAAVVLAPLGVYAATGQLVNIADPVTGKEARVSGSGGLFVESRSGAGLNSFTNQFVKLGLGWIPLQNATLPQRMAVSEVTISGEGPAGPQTVLIESWVRKGSAGSCNSVNLTDFDRVTHRRIEVDNYKSVQQLFNGPPLLTPQGASGKVVCFGVNVISIPSGSATYAATTGYKFG